MLSIVHILWGMPKKGDTDDPAMARVRALFEDSGLSLVELGRRMGYAEDTARQSAWQFMQTNDPRVSMLRKFAKAMGVPLDELTPRRKRMARKLETELAEVGCDMDPRMFTELLEERHATMHASWTVDDLVCHPDEAKAYCEQIRSEVGAPVPDHVILRRLMNARKAH
jgi:transcriptional regulator with XRE-family HTH domain